MYFDVQARVLNTITVRINENYHDKGKILDFISSSEKALKVHLHLYANSIHVHIIATEMQAAASHLFHSTMQVLLYIEYG